MKHGNVEVVSLSGNDGEIVTLDVDGKLVASGLTIADINGGGSVDLTPYTLLTTTSSISGDLQSQIDSIVIPDVSNFITSSEVASISADLQNQIDAIEQESTLLGSVGNSIDIVEVTPNNWNLEVGNSGVTASSYGSSSVVPAFTVGADGRITNVTNTNIDYNRKQFVFNPGPCGVYDFREGFTGWSAVSCTLTQQDDAVLYTPTGTDSYIFRNCAFYSGRYYYMSITYASTALGVNQLYLNYGAGFVLALSFDLPSTSGEFLTTVYKLNVTGANVSQVRLDLMNGQTVNTIRIGQISFGELGQKVATLVQSEVAITAATTLTSTAFGKYYVVSGTSADYTVTLPAAAGNNGKIISIRIAGDATKLFTIDGNSTELIDGEQTRVMWAGESAVLLCDGSGWTKIAGKSIPFKAAMYNSVNQSLTGNVNTQKLYNTVDYDNLGSIADTTNDWFKIPRSGQYVCYDNTVIVSNTTMFQNFYINDFGIIANRFNHFSITDPSVRGCVNVLLNLDKDIELKCNIATLVNSSVIGANGKAYSMTTITEIPQW